MNHNPTTQEMQILQRLSVASEWITDFPFSLIQQCIQKGWVAETEGAVVITDAGRSVLESRNAYT